MFDDEYDLSNIVRPNDLIRSYEEEIASYQARIHEVQKLLTAELQKQEVLYEEYVQDDPWSSGPMIFVGLKDAEGHPMPQFNWTQEEIDKEVSG